jgi:hypothetical protein
MTDRNLPPENTLIVGMTRSGKTSFAVSYLLNQQAACRFIFDESSRWSNRFGVTPHYTELDCERALTGQWVFFNPSRMFPDDYAAGFSWFCSWAYHCAGRGNGRKILAVDELWQWADNRTMPREFRLVTQAGSERGIRLLTCTQEPHRVNSSIVGQTTELVCFRLQEPKSWQCVTDLGADSAEISRLPLGQFVAYNRLSGAKLTGRMW